MERSDEVSRHKVPKKLRLSRNQWLAVEIKAQGGSIEDISSICRIGRTNALYHYARGREKLLKQ